MSYEAPKLYANKPKKAQVKKFQEQQQKAHKFSSPSSSSSSMGPQSSVPPPQHPPKESLARRYKFLWPMLLAVNLAVGGPSLSSIPQLYDKVYLCIFFITFLQLFVILVFCLGVFYIKWDDGFLEFSLKE